MKVTYREFGSGINVVSNEHFVAIPYHVDFSEVTEIAYGEVKVVKAGTPMAKNGIKATVTEGKSNTSLIVHGFVDKAKAEKNTGETYDEATLAALPMIQLL